LPISHEFEKILKPNSAQFRVKIAQIRAQRYLQRYRAVLPLGAAVLPPGQIFQKFFLFLGSFLAFPLWFESFLGVPYVYDIDKLPQQCIFNAKRRRHQGLDIPPPP